MMNNETVSQKPSPFADMKTAQFAQVVLIGLLLGLISWALSYALGTYVFKPVVCPAEAGVCGAATQYAVVSASLITAAIALFGFVKLRVFRPLLIVIAATVSLWGLNSMFGGMPWYGGLLASAALYALAYAMFAWLVRIRLFWVVIVLLVILIVAARLLLTR